VLLVLVMAQAAFGLMLPGAAIAGTLHPCDQFSGFHPWFDSSNNVHYSAIWFQSVDLINVQTSTVTNLYAPLMTDSGTSTAAGNILRFDMFACNDSAGQVDNYAGVFRFRDAGPQPSWNSRDKIDFTTTNADTAVEVGRYFQQVGESASYTITPILNHTEDDVVTGPALTVTGTGTLIGVQDRRGPPNAGGCGSLGSGQYEAQIAQNGNVNHGVWDNLKGGVIKALKFVAATHHIKVTLTMPNNQTTIPMQKKDPVAIENANPPGYDGNWVVTAVKDALHFTTTGPNVLTLPAGSTGTATRYYKSGDALPGGIELAGYVEVCAGTGGPWYGTEKLEPITQGIRTVRWESQSHVPDSLVAPNQPADVKWYQTMPCSEPSSPGGFDLGMWPRFVAMHGATPDDNILAEGDSFVFHVDSTLPVRSPC